jgi:ATP-dependent exoDNAse (exonuclease V) beta subunit
LVHAILQDMDFAKPENIDIVAGSHARRLRATEAMRSAAAHSVREVLRLSIFAVEGQVHRELPFVLAGKGGALIEGVIDLAVRSSSGWTLVDFKVGSAGEAKYDRQMQIYAEALRRLERLPVRACLIELN